MIEASYSKEGFLRDHRGIGVRHRHEEAWQQADVAARTALSSRLNQEGLNQEG